MPSPLNLPLPALPLVVRRPSPPRCHRHLGRGHVDTPQYQVVLQWSADIAFGADATAATFKLKRGTTTAGTGITLGETWGPATVTGLDEGHLHRRRHRQPRSVHGHTYVLTVTLTANDTTTTYENVYLEAVVTART